MTGVTAPALIISVIILFNLAKKFDEKELQNKIIAQTSGVQQDRLNELSQKLNSEKRAIPELLNGTEPQ